MRFKDSYAIGTLLAKLPPWLRDKNTNSFACHA